jgi:signal peptidase
MIKKGIVGICVGICLGWIFFLGFLILSPGYHVFAQIGGSMTPTLNHGDLVFTKPPEKKISPGTIVVYRLEDKNILVSHRVIAVNGEILRTKGDANSWVDPWQVSISELKGIYFFKIPYLGYITLFLKKT